MNKWFMHNPESVLENGMRRILSGFDIQTDPLISDRRQNLVLINKKKIKRKKRTCWIVDFAIPADQKLKLKESEKKEKYKDLGWELKNYGTKVTVIQIVIGVLSTVTKGHGQDLEDLEIREQVEAIQTTALLRSARIPRRVLETWGDLLSLRLQWKTIN